MTKRQNPIAIAALGVALLSLLVALSGGVYAAAKIDGGDLQKKSVAGNKLKNDTLTGKQIKESTLSLPALPAVVEGPMSGFDTGAVTGTVATVTFRAPANGFVRVTGSANLSAISADNSWIEAYLYQDDSQIQGEYWDAGDTDAAFDLRQSIDGVAPVTAGPHTWTLRLTDLAGTSHYSYAQVIVEFFPAGSASVGPPLVYRDKQ